MTCDNCPVLSDVRTPLAVCTNSFFDVFFNLQVSDATVTLAFNGSDHVADFSINDDLSFNVQAPATESDYTGTITVTCGCCVDCNDTHEFSISVKAPVTVDAGTDQAILLGNSTVIGVGPAVSDVLYTWVPADGISDVNAFPTIVTPISDTAYTVVAQRTDVSDCASSDSVTITIIPPLDPLFGPGVFSASYQGSLLEFTLALPPELAATVPVTSDIFEIYSDICAYADTQDCQRFLAGLTITNQSDLFCSDALILNQPEVVFVSCPGNVFHMDDIDGDFSFTITDFMSDSVTVTYSDANCGLITDNMNVIGGGFNLQTSDENFLWVNPCSSDPLVVTANVFTHPLLVIDATSNVTDIELIECAPPCQTPTSDPDQICFFKASAIKLGSYLEEHFPSDYPDNIDHACHVLYTGPVTAQVVTVDLENCELIFSNFKLPCSDVDVCSS